MVSEVAKERGLTARALFIGVAITVAVTFIMTTWVYTYSNYIQGSNYVFGLMDHFDNGYGAIDLIYPWGLWIFLLFLIIVSALPKAVRLSKQELAVVFTMLIIALPLSCTATGAAIHPIIPILGATGPPVTWGEHWSNFVGYAPYSQALRWMSPFYFSEVFTKEVKGKIRFYGISFDQGGWVGRPPTVAVPVKWDAWVPSILYITALGLSLGLCTIFIAAILRRQYVKIEGLPFPCAVVTVSLINEATIPAESAKGFFAGKPRIFSNKWLWIGFAIAQIMVSPGYLFLIGRAAGLSEETLSTFAFAQEDKWQFIIPYFPLTFAWTAPWYLGIGTMVPMDFLVSYFITWIFILGLRHIYGILGWISPPDPMGDMNEYVSDLKDFFAPQERIIEECGGWTQAAYGVLIAAAIWPIWIHRKEFINTIKAIWASHKLPKGFEEDEALPYKWLYLGAALCLVFYFAVFSITPGRMMLPLVIPFTLLWIVVFVGAGRYMAYSGIHSWSYHESALANWNGWLFKWSMKQIYGYPPSNKGGVENAPWFFATAAVHGVYTAGAECGAVPIGSALEAFTIGERTQTRTRDILIAAIIGWIIPWFITPYYLVWLFHTANWRHAGVGFGYNSNKGTVHAGLMARGPRWLGNFGYYGHYWPRYLNDPPLDYGIGVVLFGILIGGFFFWLRSKTPRFIYNPLALILWFFAGRWTHHLFFLWLLALVIKYFVIRVYGARAYEEKLIPASLGLTVGGCLYYTIDALDYWFFHRQFI